MSNQLDQKERWFSKEGLEYKNKLLCSGITSDAVMNLSSKYFGQFESDKYSLIPDLAGIEFTDLEINNAFFAYCFMNNSKFTNCKITNSQMHFTDFHGAHFENVVFKNVYLISSNFSRANIRKCKSVKTNFNGSSFIGTQINNFELDGGDHMGCNFSLAKIRELILLGDVNLDCSKIPLYLRESIVSQIGNGSLSRVLWTEEWLG